MDLKNEFHNKYKSYRILLTFIKDSKQKYQAKYIQNNLHNIKNFWKGIKSIINFKSTFSNFPRSLSNSNNAITDPYEVANNFNKYFASISEITKENIK